MASSARVKRILEELTPEERADLAASLPNVPRLLPGAELATLLSRLPKDVEFADDLESVVRERRSEPESRTSPWDR